MSYTNFPIPEFNDPFFQQRKMQEGYNKKMAAHFDPSWVSDLGESIQKEINRYTCPGWMFVPRKPHPFGNQYHTVTCAKSKVIYNVDIFEGKDQPRVVSKKDFEGRGATAGLMVRMTKLLQGTSNMVVVDSGFCEMEGLIPMVTH